MDTEPRAPVALVGLAVAGVAALAAVVGRLSSRPEDGRLPERRSGGAG